MFRDGSLNLTSSQDKDQDGRLSMEDYMQGVKQDELLLEVLGPCLPNKSVRPRLPWLACFSFSAPRPWFSKPPLRRPATHTPSTSSGCQGLFGSLRGRHSRLTGGLWVKKGSTRCTSITPHPLLKDKNEHGVYEACMRVEGSSPVERLAEGGGANQGKA